MSRTKSSEDLNSGFYEPLGVHRFRATSHCVGPWSPHLQHGGPPAALLGGCFEDFEPNELRVARLALDIYGPIPLGDVQVEVRRLRSGRKIELLEGTLSIEGRVVMGGRCWRLLPQRGRSPEVNLKLPPTLNEYSLPVSFPNAGSVPYINAIEWAFVEGGFESRGRATVWTRPKIPLVAGSTPSPLERTLVMLDSANGISAELPFSQWSFVPVHLDCALMRLPEGQWIGMSAETELGTDGIGLTRSEIFDASSTFGRGLHTLFVEEVR